MKFRKIPSLKNLYEVSDTGILRNVKTGREIIGTIEKNGYVRIRIENKEIGNVVRTTLHRLVAEAFVPNPDNKPQVNHIDLNKQNNCASNLEWVTGSENMKHAYSNGVGVKELTAYRECAKKCVTNGNDVFESISDAARWLAAKRLCKNQRSGIAGISCVLRNKRKHFGGYEWKVVA